MELKKAFFGALLVLSVMLFLAGCAMSIAEAKKDENIGKTVKVRGTVANTVKIGKLSGYTLTDEAGESIAVSSESLPEEGSDITVKGVLMKDLLIGYYIKAE